MNTIDVSLGDLFFKRIWLRMNKYNKNWLAIICGETGSGKSYTALSIAKRISGRVFTVFSPVEFLSLINSGKLQKGDIIVFDEAGVGMASREWYSVQNKLLGSVLQTFRNLNIGVIFTTPNLSFIDVQARKLFHNYFETAYIDRKSSLCLIKAYDIQVNSRLDKTYFKHPRMLYNNRTYKLATLWVQKPDDKLTDMYEKKKFAFTSELNAKALQDLKNEGKPKENNSREKEAEIVQDILKQKEKYIKKLGDRYIVNKAVVETEYGVGNRVSDRIKHIVERSL